jgi:hypothetical protein
VRCLVLLLHVQHRDHTPDAQTETHADHAVVQGVGTDKSLRIQTSSDVQDGRAYVTCHTTLSFSFEMARCESVMWRNGAWLIANRAERCGQWAHQRA